VSVDPRAASGFGDGADAYERGRPSYPADELAALARRVGLAADGTALDLGAGTGKLTRLLLPLAGRVIAVDPSEAMRAELHAQLPRVEVLAGSAAVMPLEGGSVDAVFVGEAFHWFGTPEACCEIARVLRPGGGLGLLWNRARWTEDDVPWLERFRALVRPHREAAGSFPTEGEQWTTALRESGRFGPLGSTEADYVHRVGAEDFVALVGSWSWIANLPVPERRALLSEVRELAAPHESLTLRYRTEMHWTRLTVVG
jgi:SAM-dependent methyltransferase